MNVRENSMLGKQIKHAVRLLEILRDFAEFPLLHVESSYILQAKYFLLYFSWPLIVTLLMVSRNELPMKNRYKLMEHTLFWDQ